MNYTRDSRYNVLLVSLFVSCFIVALKWWAYFISHSVALKTDALESVINIFASLIALFALRAATRPADENHPYGHGKIEYFSVAIEGGMLLLAGTYLLYESISAFFSPPIIQELSYALWISVFAGSLNGFLGLWQLNEGKRHKSQAIIADAKHILADFYTTLGVVIGLLLLKWTQILWIDSLVAALVALLLLKNAYKIIRSSAELLSDTEDVKLLKDISTFLNSNATPEHIIDIHRLRTLGIGNKRFVDLHIVMPEFWDLKFAHDKSEEFCTALNKSLNHTLEFHPHVEPCERKYCQSCALKDCPVRAEAFLKKPLFNSAHIVMAHEDDLEEN